MCDTAAHLEEPLSTRVTSSALTFDPARPPPPMAAGSMLRALAALVSDCEHARGTGAETEGDGPLLAPADCPGCRQAWALLESVLGGFSLFAAEREWVRSGVRPTLLVQLEAIAGGGAALRELSAFLGLDYPSGPWRATMA